MVNTTSIAMNIFLLNLTLVGKTDISQIPNFSETCSIPMPTYSTRTPVVILAGGLAGQGIKAARPIPHASDLDDTVERQLELAEGQALPYGGHDLCLQHQAPAFRPADERELHLHRHLHRAHHRAEDGDGACAIGPQYATQCTQDDGVADMLLGYIGSFSQSSYEPHGDIHDFSWSPYVEDRYQFNKNLTLTLGLRIYHLPLPYGVPNSETNFVPSAFNPGGWRRP